VFNQTPLVILGITQIRFWFFGVAKNINQTLIVLWLLATMALFKL